MFLVQFLSWLKTWWYGKPAEEEKPAEAKASGCPMSAGKAIPEGVTECPMKSASKKKVAGESSDANASTDGVSDGDLVEDKKVL